MELLALDPPKTLLCTNSTCGYLNKFMVPCALPALVDETPSDEEWGAEPDSKGSSQQTSATAIAPMEHGCCGSAALCHVSKYTNGYLCQSHWMPSGPVII